MADKFPEQEITPIPVSSFPVIIGNVISPVSELCDSNWQRSYPFLKHPLSWFIFLHVTQSHVNSYLSNNKIQYTSTLHRGKINLLKTVYDHRITIDLVIQVLNRSKWIYTHW